MNLTHRVAFAILLLNCPPFINSEPVEAATCEAGVCQASVKRGCIAWRQTGGCSPNGKRESLLDRDCDAVVNDGQSGYCEW